MVFHFRELGHPIFIEPVIQAQGLDEQDPG